MKDFLRKTKFGMVMACVLVAVSVLMSAGRAWALPAIQFDVFFAPQYADWKLQGILHVQNSFFDLNPFSDVQTTIVQDSFFDVGSPEHPTEPCIPTDPCRTFFDVFSDLSPIQDSFFDFVRPPNPNDPLPDSSFFSFEGIISGTDHHVYAFGPETTEATAYPPDPGAPSPLISICTPTIPTDPCRVDVTDIVAPLYAFSNATQVGYIRARVTEVPEPSTLLLLGSGLIGVVMLGRRRLIR